MILARRHARLAQRWMAATSWAPLSTASSSAEEAGCEPPLAAVHAPFASPKYKGYKTMGLQGIPSSRWIEVDANLKSDLGEKDALLRERRDQVLVSTPSSLPAQRELASMLAANLLEHHASTHADVDPASAQEAGGMPPIEWAARLVSEDLCVLEKQQGEWVFTAGSVCFPTCWSLPDKIGCGVQAVHAPVPGFAERLAPTVNKNYSGSGE